MGKFEVTAIPTVLHGCESWVLNAKVRKRVVLLEMECLKTICSVRWDDRVRNDSVRGWC